MNTKDQYKLTKETTKNAINDKNSFYKNYWIRKHKELLQLIANYRTAKQFDRVNGDSVEEAITEIRDFSSHVFGRTYYLGIE